MNDSTTNDFVNFELDGRQKAIDFLNRLKFTNLASTVNPFDTFDLIGFSNKNEPCVIEVKTRKVNIDSYPDVLIEKPKFESLIQYIDLGFIPLYLCIYKDGFILFNLKNEKEKDLTVLAVDCPSTTVETKSITKKDCYFLKPSIKGTFKNESINIT
ncbi:hypothetical protein [Cyclobacterium plantarum]|uniref:Endonuclease n=1 Tax=Cyclobacterium plantarum TaxID=2716263 RepID=A0ABX0H8I1_9BACT|nr:hypothetical protein [Cyclobacterium plantarum]NHE57969.1 hypothetical protein [Cyclobacterium plantarum]